LGATKLVKCFIVAPLPVRRKISLARVCANDGVGLMVAKDHHHPGATRPVLSFRKSPFQGSQSSFRCGASQENFVECAVFRVFGGSLNVVGDGFGLKVCAGMGAVVGYG